MQVEVEGIGACRVELAKQMVTMKQQTHRLNAEADLLVSQRYVSFAKSSYTIIVIIIWETRSN